MVASSVPLSSLSGRHSPPASSRDLLREERPAWAKPQTSWPFRVIDPQVHRPGQPAQPTSSWAS